jgi:hypothetical protein
MEKSQHTRKLKLTRETLRHLDPADLRKAMGGTQPGIQQDNLLDAAKMPDNPDISAVGCTSINCAS